MRHRAPAHQHAQRHASRRAVSLLLDDEPSRLSRAASRRGGSTRCRWSGASNPAVKLDFRHLPDGYVVTPGDVEAELQAHRSHARAARDRGGEHRGGRALRRGRLRRLRLRHGQGGDAVAARARRAPGRHRRLELGRAVLAHAAASVQETGDVGLIWEGHRAGREIGYSHLEKLHNLELLPADGFEVVCFPVKVHRASAGWTRAVAILDH